MDTLQQVAQKVGAAAKFDYSGFKYGVDTSHHNGVIDWKRVKDEGIINADGTRTKVDFAYVKITEGASGRDPKAGKNAAECYRLGLPWGVYHYCTLNDKDEARDATTEAQYFLKRLADLPPYQMPITLDIEDPKAIMTPPEVLNWINTFFAVIDAAGHGDYILYSYSPFLRKNLPPNHGLERLRLWAARYSKELPLSVPGWGQNFWMWQFSNNGKVAGISGDVDLNKIL